MHLRWTKKNLSLPRDSNHRQFRGRMLYYRAAKNSIGFLVSKSVDTSQKWVCGNWVREMRAWIPQLLRIFARFSCLHLLRVAQAGSHVSSSKCTIFPNTFTHKALVKRDPSKTWAGLLTPQVIRLIFWCVVLTFCRSSRRLQQRLVLFC